LHVACEKGYLFIADYLVSKGAHINIVDEVIVTRCYYTMRTVDVVEYYSLFMKLISVVTTHSE
jgi:hypothetical protein